MQRSNGSASCEHGRSIIARYPPVPHAVMLLKPRVLHTVSIFILCSDSLLLVLLLVGETNHHTHNCLINIHILVNKNMFGLLSDVLPKNVLSFVIIIMYVFGAIYFKL